MSDAIKQCEKDSEELRLRNIDQMKLVKDTKEVYGMFVKFKEDLVRLGYTVVEEYDKIRVYKEF